MQPFEARRRRVLVVDDDSAIRELITTRLDLAGFDTRTARDGSHALQRLMEFRPEAMVLDINMPVMDGFGVLNAMRARGDTSRVPILVLTARNAVEDVREAIALGARDYLSKPFRDDLLIQRVNRLFARQAQAAST
ncbi:MAG: response regulator transcription factor [Phenylobacterium sp.]|jgi:two-component system OmpR family response regulator